MIIAILIAIYCLGAFPSGFTLARLKGITIWEYGSGNVGATNVARILGNKIGFITLILDLLKGALAVLVMRQIAPTQDRDLQETYIALAAVAVVAGHCFSIPLKTSYGRLKGGKGVATALGAILILNPIIALVGIGLFATLFAVTRIVSLASIGTAFILLLLSAIALTTDLQWSAPACCSVIAICLLILVRHQQNLRRLFSKKESRFN